MVKVSKNIMSRISSLETIENKHDIYREKDCMETF